MKRLLSLFFLLFISSSAVNAQTLDRVYERAKELWILRTAGKKIDASKYVEPQGQEEFLSFKQPIKAEITSIELSDVRTAVNVVSKVQMFFPEVGKIERVARESWVWNGTDWFLHIEPSAPFPFNASATSNPSKEPSRKDVQVKFLQSVVDLGKHIQGEIVSGRLEFQANQKEIVTVRPADLQGLIFEPIVWQSSNHGILKFTLDTILISGSIQKSLQFDFVDSDGDLHPATVDLRADIEGRVRFTQIPKVLDANSDGICILQIQNLSKNPTRLLSVNVGNGDFRLDSAPDTILPHGIGTIKLSHGPTQTSGAINLIFSEELLGNRSVAVPLVFASIPTAAPTYTREQLEQEIRKAPPLTVPKP